MYKDKIVSIQIGNLPPWMGEIETANCPINQHPFGGRWIRIKNPVRVLNHNGQIGLLSVHQGMDAFERFVDIQLPDSSMICITALDKKGDLYKDYLKEASREKSTIIKAPGIVAPSMPLN